METSFSVNYPEGKKIAISQTYTTEEISNRWEQFFEEYDYTYQINEVAQGYPDVRSVYVKYGDIQSFDPDFAEYILNHPIDALEEGQRAMREIQLTPGGFLMNLRINDLPSDTAKLVRNLRAVHVGKFLSLKGLVKKTVEVRPKLISAAFKCERCGHISLVRQNDLRRLKEPYKCGDDVGEGCGRTQASTDFSVLVDRSTFIDSQKIEIEESPEDLEGGARAERLTVIVEDDLTGMVNPGETVNINGPLMSYPQRTRQGGKSPLFDIFMMANSIEKVEVEFEEVEITPEEEMRIIQTSKDSNLWPKMVQSISPSIKGLEREKESLVLQLFGGTPKVEPDGQRIRGDIHILLIGDPGTAKSQLLQYMSKLSPRGRFTQGRASSAAGLTAAAVKDEFGDGRWTLEAGALVLADKGLACIDELDKMSDQDRSSLHEAMEQQTVTVTKAGINATLRARCSMLAAANPQYGRFDTTTDLLKQIDKNLNHALLTRFDIIFSIVDKPDPIKDKEISEHILKSHLLGEALAREDMGDSSKEVRDIIDATRKDHDVPFKKEFMRKYVAYAKKNVVPIMTQEAFEKIQNYYLELRTPKAQEGENGRAVVSITARKLEAMVRLAEASARVRLSDKVDEADADRAIEIIDYYLRSQAMDEYGRFDIDSIETGVPSSQRGIIAYLRDILKEHDEPDGVELNKIVELAKQEGITEQSVKSILDLMNTKGDIFKKKGNRYRIA